MYIPTSSYFTGSLQCAVLPKNVKSELEDVFLYNKICLQQIYWQVMECITFKCTTLPIAKKEMWHCTLCDFTLTTSIWLGFCRRGSSDKFSVFFFPPHVFYVLDSLNEFGLNVLPRNILLPFPQQQIFVLTSYQEVRSQFLGQVRGERQRIGSQSY